MAKAPVKGQTGQRNGQRLPHVLTEAEVAALLARVNTRCPTGLRNRAALAAMLGAGLRVSELCALRGVDVDLARGTVRVNLGKGGKDRVIPVDQETRGWLQAWAERRAALQLNGQGAFFPGLRIGRTGAGVRKRGEALRPRYWQGLLTRLAEAAEIEGKRVSPHVLRHTYATHMLDRGFTIREVQELLGHASVATTQVYTHVSPEALRQKVQAQDAPEPTADPLVVALAAALGQLTQGQREALVAALGK